MTEATNKHKESEKHREAINKTPTKLYSEWFVDRIGKMIYIKPYIK